MNSEGRKDEENERTGKKRWKTRVRSDGGSLMCLCWGGVEGGEESTSDFMFAFARMFAYTRGVCLCALGEPLIVY